MDGCERQIASGEPALLISFSEGTDKHRVLKARFRGVGVVSAILRNLSRGDRRYDDSPQLFESHLARILVSF